jgi:hypothetical protein
VRCLNLFTRSVGLVVLETEVILFSSFSSPLSTIACHPTRKSLIPSLYAQKRGGKMVPPPLPDVHSLRSDLWSWWRC